MGHRVRDSRGRFAGWVGATAPPVRGQAHGLRLPPPVDLGARRQARLEAMAVATVGASDAARARVVAEEDAAARERLRAVADDPSEAARLDADGPRPRFSVAAAGTARRWHVRVDRPTPGGRHVPGPLVDVLDVPELTRAEYLAMDAHRGQLDQSGVPYRFHVLGARALLRSLPQYDALAPADRAVAQVAACLHDVLEDTAYEERDLRDLGFSDAAVSTVVAVTRQRGEEASAYYARVVKAGPVAVAVKLADLAHNTLPSRRGVLPKAAFDRLGRKYARAYAALGVASPPWLEPASRA